MLKVSRVLLAVLAALGMSSAIGQTGPVVGAFGTSVNGKTTTYDYKATGNSDFARLTRGTYDPANNNSGFQALLQKKGYTPGGKEYPVAIAKQVPKAALAKAVAKTLPIVGNAIAMAELLGELFPGEGVHWDTSEQEWQRVRTDVLWSYSGSSPLYPSADAACSAYVAYWNATNPTNSSRMAYLTVVVSGSSGTCKVNDYNREHGYLKEANKSHGTVEIASTVTADFPITEGDVQVEMTIHPTTPPVVDDLIIDIPPEALRVLAEETAAEPVRPIAVTTDAVGTPQPSGITVPESVSTTTGTNSQGQPITTTTTTQTIVRPLEDGAIQHDEQTTTTTTTQTGTNPDGSPITTTTTSTTTTQSTPAPPVTGTPGTSTPPNQEIITCGLPDTPPCKIDESGTPPPGDANFDAASNEIDVFKSGLYEALQTKLDEIVHEWTWTFQLPTGCASLQFDTRVGPVVEIDMCQWQPMIHDIMSMLWASAGVWGALMIFLRANG